MATADFRDRLLQCLGGNWPASPPLNVRVRETIQWEGFTIHSVFYDAEPNTGHVLSETMWQKTLGWFNRHLRGPRGTPTACALRITTAALSPDHTR